MNDFNDIDDDFEPIEQENSNIPQLDETSSFAPVDSETIENFFSAQASDEKDNQVEDIKQDFFNNAINEEKEEFNDDITINTQSNSNMAEEVIVPDKVMVAEPNQQNIFNQESSIVPDKTITEHSTDNQNDFNNDTLKTDDSSIFSQEFNKISEEQKILNMNKEILDSSIERESPYKKYMALLPIFAFFFTSFLGIYLFSINTKAESTNLIKIEKNNKVGYIDDNGNTIVNTKYTSGTDFYKGYAIVKNQNNLSAVLNGKGALDSSFGDYFYIERYGNRYIASKFTSSGLKLALLDSNLKELTRYKYDNITYVKNNTYLFTKDDTMGVLNSYGKEVYSYTVDEVDNKNISIEVSKINDASIKERYAMIKINNSSTIINLLTGEEVYKYTLDDIYVLENNIFYLKPKNSENYRYIVVRNNSISYETNSYKNVKIDNYNSNILMGFKENSNIDYINLNNKKIINDNENIDYSYGDGIILQKMHDFNIDKDVYTISNSNKVFGKFENIKPVTGKFSNGLLMVYVNGDKYNFINKKGNLINNNSYEKAEEYNKYGYSIVSSNGLYGILNTKGDEIVKINYDKIEFLNEDLFDLMKKKYNKELFIYHKNDKCGIIDSKGNIVISSGYDKFKYITANYPIIIGKSDNENILINLETGKDLKIEANKDVSIHDNYIINNQKYYNYDGKLIFDKNKEV